MANTKKKTGASKTAGAAKKNLNECKMEAAKEVGVSLKQGDNGDMSARSAGKVGGQMVKKMVNSYSKNAKKNG